MTRAWITLSAILLAGCGQAERKTANLAAFDVAEPPAAAPAPPAAAATPQIAYSYTFGYTLPAGAMGSVQARHVALCRSLGPARCLVLATELNRAGVDGTSAVTRLVVDARIAPSVGRRLDAVVTGAGGDVASQSVSAEDVTKDIVDTDAKVRAKQALAERLLALIRDARGGVADLVAAEKAYADVQEELDAARSLQAALRRRVAMSQVEIAYASDAHSGVTAPLAQAADTAGATFVTSLAAALTFVVAAIPWLLILIPLFLVLRLGWRRWRERRRARRTPEEGRHAA